MMPVLTFFLQISTIVQPSYGNPRAQITVNACAAMRRLDRAVRAFRAGWRSHSARGPQINSSAAKTAIRSTTSPPERYTVLTTMWHLDDKTSHAEALMCVRRFQRPQ